MWKVTARLLTNCSNTLRNMHNNNNRQTITRTRAKQKVGYFFIAHPVQDHKNVYWYCKQTI
jgi:hypothetical protein